MVELPEEEEIAQGREELVVLRYTSSWPKYTVEWTRRRRAKDGQSFPISGGVAATTDHPPDWQALRAEALTAAGADPASTSAPASDATPEPNRSLLSRLLRRS
ncbi:MAG TPA: hypothetical protein VG815_01270 [Chloroflexota bacterium]|nr:hypothetical protein [Chloroflexota bacterium]